MKYFFCLFIVICCLSKESNAQNIISIDSISKVDRLGISLNILGKQIQADSILSHRLNADSIFTKALVQQLKTPYSFNYTFDSLQSIKHIKSPDGMFKIFTWQIDLGDGTYRQRGAMQVPTNDGSLKLFPFFDNSDFVQNNSIGVFNRKKWIGAIYYDIIPITTNDGTLYTLLGFDENTNTISKKVIEILQFMNNEPIFGGDYFSYPPDPTYPIAKVDRFILQYKKGSNAIIKYNSETKGIIISELASTENDLNKIETLVPSGNEFYFEWVNNKWTMVKKISQLRDK